MKIDYQALADLLKRRAPGQNKLTTARRESDEPIFLSGIDRDGMTNGGEIKAITKIPIKILLFTAKRQISPDRRMLIMRRWLSIGGGLICAAAIKQTPSIFLAQDSVDLTKMENVRLQIEGRHDPCIVLRAVPIMESVMAITLMDMLLDEAV